MMSTFFFKISSPQTVHGVEMHNCIVHFS